MNLFNFQENDYIVRDNRQWSLGRNEYLIICRYMETPYNVVKLMRVNKKTSAIINQRKNPFNVQDKDLFPFIETHTIYVDEPDNPLDFLPNCICSIHGSYDDVCNYFNTDFYFAINVSNLDFINENDFRPDKTLYIPNGFIKNCDKKLIAIGKILPRSFIDFFIDLVSSYDYKLTGNTSIDMDFLQECSDNGIVLSCYRDYLYCKKGILFFKANVMVFLQLFAKLNYKNPFFKKYFKSIDNYHYSLAGIKFKKYVWNDDEFSNLKPMEFVLSHYQLDFTSPYEYPLIFNLNMDFYNEYMEDKMIVFNEILYNNGDDIEHNGSLSITLVVLPMHFYNKIIELYSSTIEPLTKGMYYFKGTTVAITYSIRTDLAKDTLKLLKYRNNLERDTEEVVTFYRVYTLHKGDTLPICNKVHDFINLKYDLSDISNLDNFENDIDYDLQNGTTGKDSETYDDYSDSEHSHSSELYTEDDYYSDDSDSDCNNDYDDSDDDDCNHTDNDNSSDNDPNNTGGYTNCDTDCDTDCDIDIENATKFVTDHITDDINSDHYHKEVIDIDDPNYTNGNTDDIKKDMNSTLIPLYMTNFTKGDITKIPKNDIQKFIKCKTTFITNDFIMYKLDKDGFKQLKDQSYFN